MILSVTEYGALMNKHPKIEKFATTDLSELRKDLQQSGLDSWQAAELVGAFLSGRGYGVANDELRAQMTASGRERANAFSWERVTGKVEDYYGFVIRRLAAQGALPSGFHAEIHPE